MTEVRKFDAEVGKVLQLVIHSIYTNKDIFLRELISNSSDACDKLRYEALQNSSLVGLSNDLKIKVSLDSKNHTITVEDNGIGMNKEEVAQNLGTIANSGTQRFISQLSGNKDTDLKLIGQFGVGFYSVFMIASEVSVYTSKAGEEQSYLWKSKGDGEYTIEETDEKVRGTRVALKVRDADSNYLDYFKLREIIKTYSDHIRFPITLENLEDGKEEVINQGDAIWTLNPSEVKEEQYKEFYKQITYMPDEPWAIMHNKVEGTIEYTNLLFIPNFKPFDLFHPERKTSVKLYIKRVFIADEGIEILPSYLRFVKGVIDSEDLPLNISRETVQHNQNVKKIKKSLTKKILNTLKQKAKNEPESYKKFWNNFGEVIKEGLCDNTLEEREDVLSICRFYTTNSDELISLDDYISRMKEDQNEIYYLSGNNLENLRSNPQLEGFKKRGIEVVLLADHVDDFWINIINEYKGKNLKSISASDIELDKDSSSDAKDDNTKDHSKLVGFIKETLKDKVQDVKVTSKLIDSPSCLAIPEGSMNIRMEKFLIEQKQLSKGRAKILEINPEHPILKMLESYMESDQSEKAKDLTEIVFDQACLVEGESIQEPTRFVKLINAYIRVA